MASETMVRRENRHWPHRLVEVPRDEWPAVREGLLAPPLRVWRSRKLLAVLYDDPSGVHRLSVSRADITASGAWRDGTTWDELQRAKAECGFADRWAVEIFPAQSELVNVANMRHLWLLDAAPAFAWQSPLSAREGRESTEDRTHD